MTSENPCILLVDDEPSMREWLGIFLEKRGCRVVPAGTVEEAKRKLDGGAAFDAAVCDVRLPDGSGMEVLRHGRKAAPGTAFMMMTAYSSLEDAVGAMKMGAADYLIKPFDLEEFRLRLDAVLERKALRDENVFLRRSLGQAVTLENIIAVSAAMQEVMSLVRRVAPTDSTLLLTGESGAGKEILARAIHALSPRAMHPFVSINCGAMPENLLESELFGHVKGAFTDAAAHKKGLFEAAHHGTVLLDEIAEMSPAMQVKLLRALQERSIRRVGGNEEIEVDIRVIAATNRNIEAAVREGVFREDLYYRINVISIHVPPLRERREDIRPLAEHFLKEFAARAKKRVETFAEETMGLLEKHSWPGNVRELRNAVERAVALETTEAVLPANLPAALRGTSVMPEATDLVIPEGFKLEAHLDELTRRYLQAALTASGGTKNKAAALLGMPVRSFRYLCGKLGIP